MRKRNDCALAATLMVLVPVAGGLTPAEAQTECSISSTAPEFGSNATGSLHALPQTREEARQAPHSDFHGQLLLGREATYLYHLPLFMDEPREHPHNFQVILEAEFAPGEGAARTTYLEDRDRHADTFYTAEPDRFDQTSLMLDYPGHAPLRSLPASVVRGHFERPGGERIIPGTNLDISRVVHFREFIAGGDKLEPLSYVLFGRGGELFMAHLLSAPPDFDQVLAVELEGADLPGEALRGGLYLSFSGRPNEAAERLQGGDSFRCHTASGDGDPIQMEVRVAREVYCEAGEVAQIGFAGSRPCPQG